MSEVTKICTVCGVEKSLDHFYARKGGKHGKRADCKECNDARKAVWNKTNPDKCREHHTPEKRAAWHKKNPGKAAEYSARYAKLHPISRKESMRRWRRAHLGYLSAASSKWAKAHPAKHNADGKKHKAAKLNATPKWANQFFIEEAYHLAQLRTEATGFKWHVDHIVPLQSKLVCGLHVEFNLQVIPASQNCSKKNRYWPDMPTEIRA